MVCTLSRCVAYLIMLAAASITRLSATCLGFSKEPHVPWGFTKDSSVVRLFIGAVLHLRLVDVQLLNCVDFLIKLLCSLRCCRRLHSGLGGTLA